MAAWYPCIFISGIGLLFVVITYAAWFASKRSGKHVSGMPCFGGILIALGFLLSPQLISPDLLTQICSNLLVSLVIRIQVSSLSLPFCLSPFMLAPFFLVHGTKKYGTKGEIPYCSYSRLRFVPAPENGFEPLTAEFSHCALPLELLQHVKSPVLHRANFLAYTNPMFINACACASGSISPSERRFTPLRVS